MVGARRSRRGATLLGDLVERQEAFAGALMGSAHCQLAQVLRHLAPPGMVNVQRDKDEQGSVPCLQRQKAYP